MSQFAGMLSLTGCGQRFDCKIRLGRAATDLSRQDGIRVRQGLKFSAGKRAACARYFWSLLSRRNPRRGRELVPVV